MHEINPTVAVQTSGATGPLGQPILMVSVALNGTVQELVLLKVRNGALAEYHRLRAQPGHLTPHIADAFSALVGDAIYNALLNYVGIQGTFGDVP